MDVLGMDINFEEVQNILFQNFSISPYHSILFKANWSCLPL